MTNEELKAENASLRAEVDGLVDYLRIASEVGIKIADDNLRLKAEVERLRASSFVTAVPVEEYEKLKAENERLRKAGDELRDSLPFIVDERLDDKTMRKIMNRWNAAKDGKPSA
jgi:cell division protein FtsB